MASFGRYLIGNLFGNTQAGTWNVLPAVLTAWSNLIGTSPNKTSYELYKEQAKNYKETAERNARLIEAQGAIALRNMEYEHKLSRGNDQLRIAASNAKLSGSNLDVLVRKEKIRKMNELALKANYQNQALMELTNGYNKAAMTYGELAAKAGADKKAPWLALLKGVETYVGLQVRDGKVASQLQNQEKAIDYAHQAEYKRQDYEYGGSHSTTTPNTKLSGDGIDYSSNQAIMNPVLISATSPETPASLSLDNTQVPITIS